MLAIYAPYITDTVITFEYTVPDEAEFARRFDAVTRVYPWLVWEEDGRILGYAYADRAFARAAYSWDADMSVYLDMNARGRGIGSKLYAKLEELLRGMGIHVCYALITASNAESRAFHEKHGYELEGLFRQSGFKSGAWHDLAWYTKRLVPAEDPGEMPEPYRGGTQL